MSRAARQAQREAERHFSVPVRITVSRAGLGRQLALIHGRGDETCGRGGWDMAPAGFAGIANDAIAFYCAGAALAKAFVIRFCCGYRVETVAGALLARAEVPAPTRSAARKTPRRRISSVASVSLAEWIGLAAATFVTAAVQGASGFGFAVLATPFFLLFVDPASAVQIIILLTMALSAVVLRGLERAVAPRLLLRLMLGCLAGLPLGLVGFAFSDARLVRFAVGAVTLAFAALLVLSRRRSRADRPILTGMSPARDFAAGLVAGTLTALVGMSGPPVLIYLMLVDTPVRTVRATLLAFFAFSYAMTALFHWATVGIPARTWLVVGILLPFAFLGGFVGRPLGNRLGADAFAFIAIGLLAAAGVYTLAAAAGFTPGRP